MALKNVIGIDHAVVMVKDLDQAAANYKKLGFTISPRGTHSAHMGSGNYTIMFDPDYMELLGVLAATEHNAPARAYLDCPLITDFSPKVKLRTGRARCPVKVFGYLPALYSHADACYQFVLDNCKFSKIWRRK